MILHELLVRGWCKRLSFWLLLARDLSCTCLGTVAKKESCHLSAGWTLGFVRVHNLDLLHGVLFLGDILRKKIYGSFFFFTQPSMCVLVELHVLISLPSSDVAVSFAVVELHAELWLTYLCCYWWFNTCSKSNRFIDSSSASRFCTCSFFTSFDRLPCSGAYHQFWAVESWSSDCLFWIINTLALLLNARYIFPPFALLLNTHYIFLLCCYRFFLW